jgi:hypothetical protein
LFSREVDLTHIGFLWDRRADPLVYQPILKLLRKRRTLFKYHTDKKEKKIFLIYKEI